MRRNGSSVKIFLVSQLMCKRTKTGHFWPVWLDLSVLIKFTELWLFFISDKLRALLSIAYLYVITDVILYM